MLQIEGLEYFPRYTSVKVINHALYAPDKEGKRYFEFCNEVDIERCVINLMDGVMKIHLKYWVNGEYQRLVIPRKDLTKNGLVSVLPSRGIQITEGTSNLLLDYLLYREKNTELEFIHNGVGFHTIKGERVFLHTHAYSKSGLIKSSYCGGLAIQAKGTLEGELSLIRDEILTQIPLELAWITGFSAPVISYLRKLLSLENLIIHSFGRSSSGKTVSSLLAVSVLGAPLKTASQGLFGTWMSTPNALISRLADNCGLPIVYDEASVMNDPKVISNTIYQMSAGYDKTRLTSDSTLKEKFSFSTTIISNAESGILTNDNRNQGLRVRVLSLKNITWTKSASNSEEISRRIVQNYANSGIAFVKKLLTYEESDLIQRFNECKAKVLESYTKKDVFSSRAADKIAVIYLTSLIVEELFQLGINTEGILGLMISADEDQMEERDIGLQAYHSIREQTVNNINSFVYKDVGSVHPIFSNNTNTELLPKNRISGRVVMGSDNKPEEIWVLRSVLNTMLRQAGFTDSDVILHEWRDKNVIEADKDKFTRKRTLYKNGDNVRVVIIRLKGHVYETSEAQTDVSETLEDELNRYRLSKEMDEIIEDDIA